MRTALLAALLTIAVAFAACGADDPSARATQRGKPVVVTGLLPLAEAARTIGGDDVVVVDLTPLGESPHGLTLTARERGEVENAALAIVVGQGFQPDFERRADRRSRPTLDLIAKLKLPPRADGATGPVDPHVWLDPTIMGSIATAIGNAIADAAPTHAKAIRSRAQRLVEDDVKLDAQLAQGLKSCRQRLLITQHDAFGWFAARYHLTAVGLEPPIPGPEPDLDPARVALVSPRLDDGSVTALFSEPLAPDGELVTLARQRGLAVEDLDPYEGKTADPDARDKDLTYRGAMLENLQTLQDQLECTAS